MRYKKKQLTILNEIWLNDGKISVDELSSRTGLSRNQVHSAIRGLKDRRLIMKDREEVDVGYKRPPNGRVLVSINKKDTKRIKRLLK